MTPFGPVKKCKKIIRRRKARCARAFVLPQVSDAGGAAAGQEEEEEDENEDKKRQENEKKNRKNKMFVLRHGIILIRKFE